MNIGDKAPEILGKDEQGRDIRLSDYKGRKLLRNVDLRPPYEGAKAYFYIADVDDHDYLSELVSATCKALPMPKPKKK